MTEAEIKAKWESNIDLYLTYIEKPHKYRKAIKYLIMEQQRIDMELEAFRKLTGKNKSKQKLGFIENV